MNYLITGATGMIGRAFIATLNSDDNVLVVSRTPETASNRFKDAACSIRCIKDLSSLADLNDIDCVINLAGEPIADKRWTVNQKSELQNSRWHITSQLTKLIETSKTPPSTFLSGSAIGFYGRQGMVPVTEDTTSIQDEFTHRLCETWEDIARSAQSEKTRVCLLRTGVVLAAGQGALGKMELPFKLGGGGPIGHGRQGMSWIHIDDMVAAMHFLIHTPSLSGPVNMTAPQPVSSAGFAKALGRALHRPAILPMPAFVLRIMMGEASDLLLTGQYVLPQKLQDAGYHFQFSSVDSALGAIYE